MGTTAVARRFGHFFCRQQDTITDKAAVRGGVARVGAINRVGAIAEVGVNVRRPIVEVQRAVVGDVVRAVEIDAIAIRPACAAGGERTSGVGSRCSRRTGPRSC